MLRFSFVLIPFQMLVSLAAALVLDNLSTRLSKFSRLMIFVPYAIPVVIGAMMWGFLYSPRFGPLSELFGLFGTDAPFMLSPDNVFAGLLNVGELAALIEGAQVLVANNSAPAHLAAAVGTPLVTA